MSARSAVAAVVLAASEVSAQSATPPTVVFVCEHGTAKSVIAMAYFDQLARAAGLPHRAVSRGTAPDPALPPFMRTNLAADGLDIGAFVPRALATADLTSAVLVVSFDQPSVGAMAGAHVQAQAWDGLPSVSANYARGRDAIQRRVAALVDSLVRARNERDTLRTKDRPTRNPSRPAGGTRPAS